MASKVKTFIVLVAILAIIESAFFYFVVAGTKDYHDKHTELTIGAFNDASYISGSRKWQFFYWSNESQLSNTTPNFKFPFFPVIPETPLLGTILAVCSTGSEQEGGGKVLKATIGESYDFYGLQITIHECNPYHAVLWVEPTQDDL